MTIEKEKLKQMMLDLINDHTEDLAQKMKAVEINSNGLLTQEVS